ncbi:MAG: hypothetical protein ACE5OP_00885 [Candidatus Glassbacteria bacterium]
MNTIFLALIILQLVQGTPTRFQKEEEDTSSHVVSKEKQTPQVLLTTDEFVEHYVSLTLIERECGGDWELFKKRRDEYLSSHGITEEHLVSFITNTHKEPEFWSNLLDTINRRLEPPEQENSQTEN